MDLKQASDVLRPVVVQIDDRDGNVIGSGFFVDDKAHVATAWHVVANLPSPTVALAQPNTENMRANFTGVNAALLGIRIDEEEIDVLYGTATLDSTRPDDGESIAISGYPLANPALVTTSG